VKLNVNRLHLSVSKTVINRNFLEHSSSNQRCHSWNKLCRQPPQYAPGPSKLPLYHVYILPVSGDNVMTIIVFHLITENITIMTYAFYVQHRCL